MKNYYCNTCGRQTPHKRFFHSGSSVAAYATCGLWLLARPLYPLRCIICGNKLGDPTTKADTLPLPDTKTLKKCPLCAETIKLEANKCRFCEHLFDPEEVDSHIQALKAKEEEKASLGLNKCPSCGNWDVYHAYVEGGGLGWWCPHCKKSVSGDFKQIKEMSGANVHMPEDVGLKQVESSIIASAFVGAFIGLFIGLVLGGIIAGLGGPTIISVIFFLGAPIAGIIIMIRLSTKD